MISTATAVITTAVKMTSVCAKGKRAWDEFSSPDPNWKVIASEGVVAILETVNIFPVSTALSLTTRAALMVADPVRMAVENRPLVNIVTTTAGRLLDVGSTLGNTCPELLCGYDEKFKDFVTGASAFLIGVEHRETFAQGCRMIYHTLRGREFDQPPPIRANTPQPNPFPQQFRLHIPPAPHPVVPIEEMRQYLLNPSAVQSIPRMLHLANDFRRYQCALSHEPIRTIAIARGTADAPDPSLYEKDKLSQWRLDHPNEIPQGWPMNLPFTEENIVPFPLIQGQIDRGLVEFAESFISRRENERFFSL